MGLCTCQPRCAVTDGHTIKVDGVSYHWVCNNGHVIVMTDHSGEVVSHSTANRGDVAWSTWVTKKLRRDRQELSGSKVREYYGLLSSSSPKHHEVLSARVGQQIYFDEDGVGYPCPRHFPAAFVCRLGYLIIDGPEDLPPNPETVGMGLPWHFKVVFPSGISSLPHFVAVPNQPPQVDDDVDPPQVQGPVTSSVIVRPSSGGGSAVGRGYRADRTFNLTSRPLTYRSDADIPYTVTGGERVMTQRHNAISNLLLKLGEKARKDIREVTGAYDALILGIERDKLIEMKADGSSRSIHTAIGQLYDYRRGCPRPERTDLAVILPENPDPSVIEFLASLTPPIQTHWVVGDSIQGLAL